MLTPKRKPAGKAIARKSKKKLANECLSDERTRYYIFSNMGRIIRTEIRKMSSLQSVLLSQSPEDLKMFTWDVLYDELQRNAPTFLFFLKAATETNTPRSNEVEVMCVCVRQCC